MSLAVPRIYAIADRDALEGRSLPDAVAEIAAAGVRWIQVRAKGAPGEELRRSVAECLRRVEGTGVSLWVDDRVDVAAVTGAFGVHLGQADLPAGAARRVLGEAVAIGVSTHDLSQLGEAACDPAVDVVAIGPVFPTLGKRRPDPVVGLELLREARRLTSCPIVAIGGITAATVAEVLAAGADCVAMIGAICRGDLAANCREVLSAARAAT